MRPQICWSVTATREAAQFEMLKIKYVKLATALTLEKHNI